MRKPPRHKTVSRGKPLRISVATQHRYLSDIDKLVEPMLTEVQAEFTKLFSSHPHFNMPTTDSVGMDAGGIASATRILVNKMKAKYDQLFGKNAGPISNKMADSINRHSHTTVGQSISEMPISAAKDWTISLKSLSKKTLQILKSSSAASADFIKSIPERYLNTVAGEVYNSITTGNGLQDLVPFFDKQASTIKNWAHNTALDQTRKMYNGLNKGRMQSAGITQGEWLHSGGSQHPRELHEDFDGQLYDLDKGAPVGDDGGNMVDPGEEPNCRCTFSPVIAYTQEDEEDDARLDAEEADETE